METPYHSEGTRSDTQHVNGTIKARDTPCCNIKFVPNGLDKFNIAELREIGSFVAMTQRATSFRGTSTYRGSSGTPMLR